MHKYSLWVRLPVTAIAITVIVAVVVSIIGWIMSWDITQFSNGMFIAGAIVILIAAIFSFNRKSPQLDPSQPDGFPEEDEPVHDGIRLWIQDMRRGHNAVLLMTLVGALLIVISVWISSFV